MFGSLSCFNNSVPLSIVMTLDILLCRRLHIRGHNGKIYPYLVVNDSGLADARREERVLQLLRMLNHLLGKHKETSRRFLNMTVARVVAVSPQMRLVQVCFRELDLSWKMTLKFIPQGQPSVSIPVGHLPRTLCSKAPRQTRPSQTDCKVISKSYLMRALCIIC